MSFKERARLLLLRSLAPTVGRRVHPGSATGNNVVVIRPDHLGDLLLSAPAIRRLRELLPGAKIALLVGPWNQEAAEHIPGIHEVLTLDFPWFDRRPKRARWEPYLLLFREAERLRAYAWDTAVVLRHDFWWGAMLAARAGIPRRIGYAMPETRPFLTQSVPFDPDQHAVAQDLRLVEAALSGEGASPRTSALEFSLSPEEEAFAEDWLGRSRPSGPLVAVHPGAGAPVKRWPTARFAALVVELAEAHGATVVLTGAASEQALVEAVASEAGGVRPLCLIGAGLGQLAAALRRCALAIGVDSGVMHLAEAVGVPTVRLYGPADPAHFGPWREPSRHCVVRAELPCVPCDRLDFSPQELPLHPCIRAITVSAVLKAAEPFLALKPVAS